MRQARHNPPTSLSKVDKLRQDAHNAAAVRAFQTHPDVVALRTERIRSQVDTLLWVAIVLGLGFTMVNVQTFASAGAAVWSLPWLSAWLLDPMVSLALIAVLRAEQVTARYQVQTGPWVRRTKVFAFAANYVMNTWASWQALNPAGIVLHSVPPVLVYCVAETGPILRDRLTEAVLRAARMATDTTAPAGVQDPSPAPLAEPFTNPALNTGVNPAVNPAAGTLANPATDVAVNSAAPAGGTVQDSPQPAVRARRTPARRPARKTGRKGPAPRKLRADYLAEARAAWSPEVEISPAWVRQVTACSRGMSSQVAADLSAEVATHPALTTVPTAAPEPAAGPSEADTSDSHTSDTDASESEAAA